MLISDSFDFDAFARAVMGVSLPDIQVKLQQEMYEVDRRTAGNVIGAPKARASGAPEYRNMLGGLTWLLQTGTKPSSIQPWDFAKMRPLIESLVNRGELKPAALEVFRNDREEH